MSRINVANLHAQTVELSREEQFATLVGLPPFKFKKCRLIRISWNPPKWKLDCRLRKPDLEPARLSGAQERSN